MVRGHRLDSPGMAHPSQGFDWADAVAEVDRLAADVGFSGVVRLDLADTVAFERAYGFAHRGERLANAVDTRFALASGSKTLTALTVLTLVEEGVLELSTPARAFLGDDLPLVDGQVTVEHLLAHRSGIGDYIDEDGGWDISDYVMPVPVHQLVTTEDYLAVLDGFPAKFPAGQRFSYCNSGYVVLALLAERASGVAFHRLVRDRVCAPASMVHSAFLRSDELPGGVALGYLSQDSPRTNVLHLPVLGSGDGGMYATAGDVRSLWSALFDGRIVSPASVTEMTRPRSASAGPGSLRYGLGLWLHPSADIVFLEGSDAGVSFRSIHDPVRRTTATVISNVSDGAWALSRRLDQLVSRDPLP